MTGFDSGHGGREGVEVGYKGWGSWQGADVVIAVD